jgi:hypothetical protein
MFEKDGVIGCPNRKKSVGKIMLADGFVTDFTITRFDELQQITLDKVDPAVELADPDTAPNTLVITPHSWVLNRVDEKGNTTTIGNGNF